ncbi:P-loop containing nucleoside triphosphate hydrolase protein [Venturia nashicola]|nr:P-loop containing nucleoside triphosphate hydrolase protein [Venturia nashicola]
MAERFGKRWDGTQLPVVPKPSRFDPDELGTTNDVDMNIMVGAIQNGESHVEIRRYLDHFKKELIRTRIHTWVKEFPAIFYAVQTNDEKMIRLIAEFGGDVDVCHGLSKIPLLGFTILSGNATDKDTTSAVITLLALGASAEVFPKSFYSPYSHDIPPEGPTDEHLQDLNDENKRWCKTMQAKVAAALNLSQRYYLDKSTKIIKPSTRELQLTGRRYATALLGIPYLLVGQNAAAALLKDYLLAHMLEDKEEKAPKPLVLVFAGPSGHGKTELATQLGQLLAMELLVVDCTSMDHERDLFGGRRPWSGWEEGAKLNNFLAQNDGRSSVVFLDEFEKTSEGVHNALLKPFDEGKYEDRRTTGTMIDTSRTIWIIATNAVDKQIMRFWDKHQAALSNEKCNPEGPQLIKKLCLEIRKEFKQRLKFVITGRINGYIPFLPFSEPEQAVGVHKHLLELMKKLRKRVNLAPGEAERMLGDVRLHIQRDATVSALVAEDNYDRDLGFRSLKNAVKDEVEREVIKKYLQKPALIAEDKEPMEYYLGESDGLLTISEKLEPLK